MLYGFPTNWRLMLLIDSKIHRQKSLGNFSPRACFRNCTMSNSIQRYQNLGYKEALSRNDLYPIACKELSLILRQAYAKLPKNLQSIIFHDTLTAFRLLPEMQTRIAISAAHLLSQSAEAALPKQKKNMAVTEFKHAKVAQKRRSKSNQEEESATELPEDVLACIFSFLDIQSLASVGQVCWSWTFAASDNNLWQSQYATYFGNGILSDAESLNSIECGYRKFGNLRKNKMTSINIDWKEAFKRAYLGNSSKRLTSKRGYCDHCESIVWLNNMRCCNEDCSAPQHRKGQIIPVSLHQVLEYLLDGSSSLVPASDSESESDDGSNFGLWAYPRFTEYLEFL
ncbi:hypothetical protein K2173_028403 [Erythroxylum novogranatense]|uniref:F-box domain-containing protein n=1 Tax=Erythroxylum novogranatense TaxID=1862640 RepID=A0AAV8U1R9_9ROSI|nr:hypothetical protein K2173_028403 [Erythroxylum novogranatense]